jgi:hypothetical protein
MFKVHNFCHDYLTTWTAPMSHSAGIDLDHTSFAVHDAMGWARRLRRQLGATPIAGEMLEEFRYLLLYVGTAEGGARLELFGGSPEVAARYDTGPTA